MIGAGPMKNVITNRPRDDEGAGAPADQEVALNSSHVIHAYRAVKDSAQTRREIRRK